MDTRVNRGEVWMFEFSPPGKRRPVLVLTRQDAIGLLRTVIVTPITSTIRGAPSEVVVGSDEGLKRNSASTSIMSSRRPELVETLSGKPLDGENGGGLSRAPHRHGLLGLRDLLDAAEPSRPTGGIPSERNSRHGLSGDGSIDPRTTGQEVRSLSDRNRDRERRASDPCQLAELAMIPGPAFVLFTFLAATEFHTDGERLRGTLEKLSEFGRNPEGGVTRIGFSETDLAAREYVSGLMKEAGLEVQVDPAGNLFGTRAGTENLPLLLFGSHIDSVVQGGNFDGDVGSMASIEVLRTLHDRGVRTRHPLAAVIWSNEEGNHFGLGTLGSGVAAGLLGPEILDRTDDEGLSLADWLRRYGQDPSRLLEARMAPDSLAGYLELHIEQGPKLDEARIPIGVVQGIVGLKRFRCVSEGFANHAGTTPMNRRRDALAAAAKHALAVREVVNGEAGHQVGTVGYLRAEPGVVNVVPGRAEFPVELRDLDAAKIDRLWERIQERFRRTDEEEGVETRCALQDHVVPAHADPSMQAAVREAAESLGLPTLDLPSAAVQDAQQIARIAPMAMIFVPSRGGISHSPREHTSWEDVANGAEVLYRTILFLDERLNRDGSQ